MEKIDFIHRGLVDIIYKNLVYKKAIAGAVDDREVAHDKAFDLMERYLEKNFKLQSFLTKYFTFEDPSLTSEIYGLFSKNPFMIAAGLDKNASCVLSLSSLGSGWVEIGTIPRYQHEGAKRPRIKMLPDGKGMFNWMCYPSDGVDKIAERLEEKYPAVRESGVNLILNIGPNKPSFDKGTQIEDTVFVLEKLYQFGDVFNFGFSPNTTGLLDILEGSGLCELLCEANKVRKEKGWKPFFIKLGADHSLDQIDQILDVAINHSIDGFVAVNTTTDPNIKKALGYPELPGGYSGPLLRGNSSRVCRYIYQMTEGVLPIIACGGLKNALGVWESLTYDGASHFQFLTPLVVPETSTPNFFYNISKDLSGMLKSRGFKNISEARGAFTNG